YIADNDSPTAPVDLSCHVFETAGGKVLFNMDWSKYQIEESEMGANGNMHGNIKFIHDGANIVGLGTTEKEIEFELSYVDPHICAQYNHIAGLDVDLTIPEATHTTLGDENTALANQPTACFPRPGPPVFYKIYYVW